MGGDAQDDLAGEAVVGGEDRADEAALAALGEVDRVVGAVVGHQRADRAEGLDRRGRGRAACGLVAAQQDRGRGRRRARVGADDLDPVQAAGDDRRDLGQLARRARGPRRAGRGWPAGPCGRARRRDRRRRSWRGGRAAPRRRRRAAARGTKARRMAVHFCPALTVISRATSLTKRSNSGRAGGGVGAEQREVERVGLHGEADRVARSTLGWARRRRPVRGRAGEGDDVLAGQVLEQVADAAADQLQRTLGQDAGFDDPADHRLGDVGGLAGRLDDRRHAGEQRGRQLLQHAPAGEVEGVDVDGRTLERHADVLADEAAALARGSRARRRGGRWRWAARAGPCWRRRTACRCRPRRRSRRRCGWRRWAWRARRTPPCAPSGARPAPSACSARWWKVSRRRAGPPTVRAWSQHGGEVEAGAVDLGDGLAGDGVGQDGRAAGARRPSGPRRSSPGAWQGLSRHREAELGQGRRHVGLPAGEQLGLGCWRRP